MLAIDRWRKWRPWDEKLEESPGCEPPKPSESTFEGFEGSASGELPNYSDVPSDDPAERRAGGEEMSRPAKRKPKPQRKPPVSVTSEDIMTLEEAAVFLRLTHPVQATRDTLAFLQSETGSMDTGQRRHSSLTRQAHNKGGGVHPPPLVCLGL